MASNPVTFCDGHDVDFVAVTGQILMAVRRLAAGQCDPGPGGALLEVT
jgi:hypothetical protein